MSGTAPFHLCKNSLTENGRLVLVLAGLPALLALPWISMTSRQRVITGPAPETPELVRKLAALAEQGRFKPIIGDCFPFEDIVQAHRRVDTGHKRCNLVVRLVDADPAAAAAGLTWQYALPDRRPPPVDSPSLPGLPAHRLAPAHRPTGPPAHRTTGPQSRWAAAPSRPARAPPAGKIPSPKADPAHQEHPRSRRPLPATPATAARIREQA